MPQERQIEHPEHQDNSDIYEEPRQEVVSQEQDVDGYHDGYHREHVQHDGSSCSHWLMLLRLTTSPTPQDIARIDPRLVKAGEATTTALLLGVHVAIDNDDGQEGSSPVADVVSIDGGGDRPCARLLRSRVLGSGHRLTGASATLRLTYVSSAEIDDYLGKLDEPKRSTLQQLRETILALVPEAEQGIYYTMPAFWLNGKAIAGFAAFKNHLSYLPYSGSVIPALRDEVAGYNTSKGALQFPIDVPLPKGLVERLVTTRIAQAWSDP
jgi:uncharacterized protein YdhG (YjbR/CyaY superfamily)